MRRYARLLGSGLALSSALLCAPQALRAEERAAGTEGSRELATESITEPRGAGSAFFGRGVKQMGIAAGYGLGFRFGSQSARRSVPDLANVRFVEVLPRFGFQPFDRIGGEHWYRGNLDVLLEGTFIANTNPGGYAIGATNVLRWNFLAMQRVVPFADIFLGVMAFDMNLPNQADGHIFNVGGGLGSYWFFRDRTALAGEVRYQHLSNAYTLRPNRGINDVLFLVSLSHFWR